MAPEQARRMRAVQHKFRMRGLTLNMEALKCVLAFFDNSSSSSLNETEALELLLTEIDKQALKSNVVGKEEIEAVLSLLTGLNESDHKQMLQVIDAFQVPRISYDSIRKVFHSFIGKLPIHGNAPAKAYLYRDRLQLLQQRLLRDKHFAKPAFGGQGSHSGSCEMTPLQSLVGCTGRRWVMGVISQLEDGHFFLEDLSASIPITTGFFTENSVIVAEGDFQANGVFQIHTLGFPPLESREASLQITAGIDFFGGGVLSSEEIIRLEQLEKRAVNDMFVILSDVWLDSAETMQKLEEVLDGYESVEVVPSLFIFLGNFCSHPCNLAFYNFFELRSQFEKLGSLIASRPRIKDASRFLFIPGPGDPGPANVLPRPALPKFFTDEILKHLPNSIFGSNPCRIRFYSQEIVLFREDLQYRMRRSCICTPSEDETSDPFEHLVVTITHQSHLCPLPLTTQPIIWNYDHALSLYPIPHTIILGDRAEQKVFHYMGVTCFNPGSFANDGTFVAYRPATREAEMSSV
ncbi:unnamed protein product [Sphagnum jensenii]|uniref:DNA polymerase epsilon subunit n=1 Tax=Sphagnum jensenii TaxID=128206 RepID=A0ABP1AMJ4_9BRYO